MSQALGANAPTGASATRRDTLIPEALNVLATRATMRRHMRLYGVASDIAAISFSYAIAGVVRFGVPFHGQVLAIVSVLLPVYIAVAATQRAYHITSVMQARIGTRHALFAFMIMLSLIGLVVFFLKVSSDFSRVIFGVGGLISAGMLPLSRFGLARFARSRFGDTPLNVVLIEDGISLSSSRGVVVLNAERDNIRASLNDPVMLDRLGRCLRFADRVIVACPPERRRIWSDALRGADVEAEVLAPELDDVGAIRLQRYAGRGTIVVASGPLGLVDRLLKRCLDLFLTLFCLPIVVPLMAICAIAIKLDSKGPVFFVQERVGLGNRLFDMYKFRSMRVDRTDGAGHRSAGRDDDRVTKVGRLLRRTSLDELPQILNVLGGAMSLVGPRPHALGSRAEDRLFWDIDLKYWHRHAVKPGMTGLAQIRGYRGATERQEDFYNRLHADLEYLSDWTIWRDIAILFATFKVVIHRNAF